MNFLSKLKNKHVWNNSELKRKSEQYDKFAIGSMLLVVLSAWLSPQYIAEYAKHITLGLVGLAILFIVLSWKMERDDKKYAPPPVEENQDNVNQ